MAEGGQSEGSDEANRVALNPTTLEIDGERPQKYRRNWIWWRTCPQVRSLVTEAGTRDGMVIFSARLLLDSSL